MLIEEFAGQAEPEEELLTPNEDINPEASDSQSTTNWRPPVAMLGIAFDNLTLADAVSRIETMIATGRPHYVVTANVDFLVQARRDAELRRILLDAHLVLCDGTPLVWTSRLLGNPLLERVAGADLVPQLLHVAAEKQYRLFFLGATPEANERAVANVQAKFHNILVTGHYSPPFRPLSEMDHTEIARHIRASRPDLLLVAFGCPKAEKWIALNYQSLGVPVTMGVGGTIDFLAGHLKRAPAWMQQAGLEWTFRSGQAPRPLFKRYAADLWQFGRAMMAQWGRMRLHAGHARPNNCCALTMSEVTWRRVCAPEVLDAPTLCDAVDLWEDTSERHCLVDLTDVKFMDSTGVGLLLRLRQKLQTAGRCLVLISPSRAALSILKWMGVQDLFLIADDAIDARRLIAEQCLEPAA